MSGLFLLLLLAGFGAQASPTRTRVALVIANQEYKAALRLRTPVRDGQDIAAALRVLGYTVMEFYNVPTKEEMENLVNEFEGAIKTESSVLFYYAGHGAQINGRNYLLPSGSTPPRNLEELEKQSMSLERVYTMMKSPLCKQNIVIIGACRTNIFGGIKGWVDGLAPPTETAPDESIIAYATDVNKAMPDDPYIDGHSIYARALLKYIRRPGLKIEDFFKIVQSYVSENREGQRPWYTSSFSDQNRDAYFKEPAYVKAIFGHIDDEATLLINDRIAMLHSNDGGTTKKVYLEGGKNTIELKIFNAKSYDDVCFRLTPQGWNYRLCFYGPGDSPLTCFEDGENRPVNNGPRHGKTFTVLVATIIVDEISGAIEFANIDKDHWRR